jgi:hypothetical protein
MTPVPIRFFRPVLALALLSAPIAPALAFSFEAQLQCTADAYRFCAAEIPNVDRITACMKEKRDLLSAGCRSVMERDEAASGLQGSQTRAQDIPTVGMRRR